MATFNLDQDSFAFYNDDGSESAATIIGTVNTNPTLEVDTTYHARLLLQEDGGGSNTVAFTWQYSLNSGTWTNVTTTSSVVKAVNSANLTDGADCTQRIGSGTFISNNNGVTEDGSAGTCAFAGNDEAETLLAFQIVSTDVIDTDSVQLRVSECNTFTRTPDITVNEASTVEGVGAFTGVASFTATGQSTFNATGSFAGVASFPFAGTTQINATGDFAGVAAFTAVGQGLTVVSGDYSFAGVASFAATGTSTSSGVGSFAGVAAFNAVGAPVTEATYSFTGSSVVSGVGTGRIDATGAFAGTSSFAFVSGAPGEAEGTFTGTSVFAAVGESTNEAVYSFTGSSVFAFVGSGGAPAAAAVTGGAGRRRKHRQFVNLDGNLVEVRSFKEAEKLIQHFNKGKQEKKPKKLKKRRLSFNNGPYVSVYDAYSMPQKDVKQLLNIYHDDEEMLLLLLMVA
jgi:hypothetical protein